MNSYDILKDKENSLSMEECCKYLKIYPVQIDNEDHNCPYYAGPVTILCVKVGHKDEDTSLFLFFLSHDILTRVFSKAEYTVGIPLVASSTNG